MRNNLQSYRFSELQIEIKEGRRDKERMTLIINAMIINRRLIKITLSYYLPCTL